MHVFFSGFPRRTLCSLACLVFPFPNLALGKGNHVFLGGLLGNPGLDSAKYCDPVWKPGEEPRFPYMGSYMEPSAQNPKALQQLHSPSTRLQIPSEVLFTPDVCTTARNAPKVKGLLLFNGLRGLWAYPFCTKTLAPVGEACSKVTSF